MVGFQGRENEVDAGEPPSKMRLEGDMTPTTTPADGNDPVIEIGDDEDTVEYDTQTKTSNTEGSNVKQEPPDFTNTMPADSTQGPDPKPYTLDGETSKNLTDFLDNLMTAHGTGGSSNKPSHSTVGSSATAGSSALSQLAQMTSPKVEATTSWDDQQSAFPPSSSQPGAPSLSSPPQVGSYFINTIYCMCVLFVASNHCSPNNSMVAGFKRT